MRVLEVGGWWIFLLHCLPSTEQTENIWNTNWPQLQSYTHFWLGLFPCSSQTSPIILMLTHSVKKRNKQQQCLRLAVPSTFWCYAKKSSHAKSLLLPKEEAPVHLFLCCVLYASHWATPLWFTLGGGGEGSHDGRNRIHQRPAGKHQTVNSEPGSSSKNKAKGVSAHTSQEINMKHRLNTTKSKNSTRAMHACCQSCKESQTGGCLPGQGCFHSSLHSSKPGCCPGVTLSFSPASNYTDRDCPSMRLPKLLCLKITAGLQISPRQMLKYTALTHIPNSSKPGTQTPHWGSQAHCISNWGVGGSRFSLAGSSASFPF